MKKRIFVVAAVIICNQLQAQQDSTGLLLDEVVLTTHKYPKKQSETGKVIHVISRQAIEKSGGKTLGELLNAIPGTTIIGANNNMGTNQTISIRGASAGNVLVLLDGIPMNDPSVISNYFDLNFIQLDQVERIEILKGGQSTLYGSDAVAGVVNIIMKKAGAKKIQLSANLSGGSYKTFKESIGISGRMNNADYSINYTHLGSDGFSSATDADKTGTFDDDGLDQHALSSRLNFPLAKRLKATLFGNFSTYKTDIDYSAFLDDRDFTAKNLNIQPGGGIVYSHGKGESHFNYSFNYVERDYLDDSVHKSNPFGFYSRNRFTGRTHFAELYNNWDFQKAELLVGTDFRFHNTNQSYFSTGLLGPYTSPELVAEMHQFSPYASVVFKLTNEFRFETGGRLNIHSEYGSNFTFTLNPSYSINKSLNLFANFYSAFKAPTLYQLFDPFAGNSELDPEKALVGEAGASLTMLPNLKLRLTGFYRRTKDAILYSFDPINFTSKYINASVQKNYGAELEASYSKNGISIGFNYTYTDGETTTAFDGTGIPLGKDTTYYNLYRIPKHALNLNAGCQVSNEFYGSMTLRTVSKRTEFLYGNPPETLKGYTTIDVYGEYKFGKKLKVFLDLKNILNKEYFDFRGYNARRFNFMAGINFNL